jgi:hypothetical protein
MNMQNVKTDGPGERLSGNSAFMDSKQAAELFRDHAPDPETADAIARELTHLREEAENCLRQRVLQAG